MKYISLFSLVFIGVLNIKAADQTEVQSQITDVTVYLKGAQVTREASVSIPRGESSLIFAGLPQNVDPQSIQASGEGNFIILSLQHRINYLASQRKTPEVKMLEDSIRIYEDDLAFLKSQVNVMKSEEEMLEANRSIGSQEKGVILNDLKLAADFYRARLTEIKKETVRLNRAITEKQKRLEVLKNQLAGLNSELQRPTSEVLVKVSSTQSVKGKLYLTYTVFEAGWVPSYDIRAKDIQNPVQMIYNAKVYQNSGESWDKVALRLSTANPRQRGEKPEIHPWYIDFEQPVVIQEFNLMRTSKATAPIAVDEMRVTPQAEAAGTVSDFVQVDVNQTNLEFVISIPYDIPSDNTPYTINIQDFSLPASYEYYTAPRLDNDAFLLARITGWENYNLLPGEINLFFEGTYVGKSYLNLRNTNDTLDISLGRDKGIVIKREKLQDLTSQRTIGSNIRESRTWEISVRNNKRQAVELKINDQLPIAMNRDIEVEADNLSGGNLNKETGIITWKQRIEPGTEKKIRLSFAVKYPKDKKVYID